MVSQVKVHPCWQQVQIGIVAVWLIIYLVGMASHKMDQNVLRNNFCRGSFKTTRCVTVHVFVCGESWQRRRWTPMGDSALPSWSLRLWHAFKRAAPTKRPIQSELPCFSSPLNPRGTWLLNSNKSQETASVIPPPPSTKNVKHLHNTTWLSPTAVASFHPSLEDETFITRWKSICTEVNSILAT